MIYVCMCVYTYMYVRVRHASGMSIRHLHRAHYCASEQVHIYTRTCVDVMAAHIAPLCESCMIVQDAIMSLEGGVEIEDCAGDTGT